MLFHRESICPTARAWAELDMSALHHNVQALRSRLPQGCELMPAVKANAYGHGAVLISRELNNLGVRAFCVATAEEGAELRKNGIKGEILVLGYTHPEQFANLRRWKLSQTVLDFSYAEKLNNFGKKLKVHVKIDTGMHRLGERCERIDELAAIFNLSNLQIAGVFTHLCASSTTEPEDRAFTLAQSEAFYRTVEELKKRGCACPKLHLLASGGVLNYPELGGDYARVGIALYGLTSTNQGTERSSIDLRPVLSLKTRVTLVKNLHRGESAGYDLKFTAERETKLALLAIGYADGLPRSLSCGAGEVLINGHRAPIVGRICMDQTMVDVTGIPSISAGDEAVLIGKSGGDEITACDLAERAGTISNEILSRLSSRLGVRPLPCGVTHSQAAGKEYEPDSKFLFAFKQKSLYI